MIMQYMYTYTREGECEPKRLSSLTKSSESPLFKSVLECEGCFESLTYPSHISHLSLPQPSHGALLAMNMYAKTAVGADMSDM